ncbi:hypothetical protein M9458_051374, partial [Cirrhinus mrigala]
TTELSWREGILRCLESVQPQSRTSPPANPHPDSRSQSPSPPPRVTARGPPAPSQSSVTPALLWTSRSPPRSSEPWALPWRCHPRSSALHLSLRLHLHLLHRRRPSFTMAPPSVSSAGLGLAWLLLL